MGAGSWVALFSGGKDSSWALANALHRGLDVERLLTMVPPAEAWLFHVPGTGWADVLAEGIGIPLTTVRIPEGNADELSIDASTAGDREAAHLENALVAVDDELDGDLAGIVSGAVASEFQHARLERLAATLGIEHFAPLWGTPPEQTAKRIVADGFDVRFIAVAAAGLDRDWLGRRFDEAALAGLRTLADRYGVHPLGEGGEFETVTLDGPHMQRPVSIDAAVVWEGDRGHLEVVDARCEPAGTTPRLEITDRS